MVQYLCQLSFILLLLKTCKAIVQIKGGLHFGCLFKLWEKSQTIKNQNEIRLRCVQMCFYPQLNLLLILFRLFQFYRRNKWPENNSAMVKKFHCMQKTYTCMSFAGT